MSLLEGSHEGKKRQKYFSTLYRLVTANYKLVERYEVNSALGMTNPTGTLDQIYINK